MLKNGETVVVNVASLSRPRVYPYIAKNTDKTEWTMRIDDIKKRRYATALDVEGKKIK
jgi:hypothetical protein